MRALLLSPLLVSLAISVLTPPVVSAAGPYAGKVIAADTQQPLAGAVVLVYWLREAPGIGRGPTQSFLLAEEKLTNTRGQFVVGETPPRTWIPGTWVSPAHITIFYPGYGDFPTYYEITNPPPPAAGYEDLLRRRRKRGSGETDTRMTRDMETVG